MNVMRVGAATIADRLMNVLVPPEQIIPRFKRERDTLPAADAQRHDAALLSVAPHRVKKPRVSTAPVAPIG